MRSSKIISIRLFPEKDFLILKVEDTGAGFDAETAGRIFQRGFTTKSSGTGLGLQHCRDESLKAMLVDFP
jgi:signal transduction histidine kinase